MTMGKLIRQWFFYNMNNQDVENKGKNMDTSRLSDLMQEKAEAVQAIVTRAENLEKAFDYALDETIKKGGKTIAGPGFDEKSIDILKNTSVKKGVELIGPPLRESMTHIFTAITPADYGIAETGTLVIDSSKEDMRIATMLAQIHIALLPVSKIVENTEALENTMTNLFDKGPCYLSFITGASRTADIERVLTIGVHGPEELHIILSP